MLNRQIVRNRTTAEMSTRATKQSLSSLQVVILPDSVVHLRWGLATARNWDDVAHAPVLDKRNQHEQFALFETTLLTHRTRDASSPEPHRRLRLGLALHDWNTVHRRICGHGHGRARRRRRGDDVVSVGACVRGGRVRRRDVHFFFVGVAVLKSQERGEVVVVVVVVDGRRVALVDGDDVVV